MVKMNIHSIIQTIKNAPYNIKYGIANLIYWFPVIWKDRDWDQYYIYVILKRKLEFMEALHLSDESHLMCAEETSKEIKRCITLLDRLVKDEYDENSFKKYYEKWGKPKFDWIPIDNECSSLEITNEKVKTEKDKKQQTKEFRRAGDHERNMRKQDIEYLFKYMSKHIEGWWD